MAALFLCIDITSLKRNLKNLVQKDENLGALHECKTKLKNLGLNVLKPLRYAEQRKTLSNMDRNLSARMNGTR